MTKRSAPSFSLGSCLIPIGLFILAPIVLIAILALSPLICAVILLGWAIIIIITALNNGLFGGE